VATKLTVRRASTSSEPTARPAGCCHHDTAYCSRCDLLVGLAGLHVVAVDCEDGTGLRVVVESGPQAVGCRSCGVIAHSHGRRDVRLVDARCFGRPVELVWRKRVKEATLDPFHGYKNAIDDQLQDAVAVLDAFYAEVLVMPMWSALVLVGVGGRAGEVGIIGSL
jgi:hypothetical protein